VDCRRTLQTSQTLTVIEAVLDRNLKTLVKGQDEIRLPQLSKPGAEPGFSLFR
jgi:hypothetical protein